MGNVAAPTALIAEDEPLLAASLQAELARVWPELRVVAVVSDGLSAVEQALESMPDVVFFDIRMPGQSGLEAAAALAERWPTAGPGARPFPAVVFVTAYDQYAVQAFEAQAIDYLLKPVQPERLRKTVDKLRDWGRGRALGPGLTFDGPVTVAEREAVLEATLQRLASLASALVGARGPTSATSTSGADRTPLRTLMCALPGTPGATVRPVPIADVLAFDAADKYVRVLTADREYLIRMPLKDLLPRLDPHEFWQVHRGTVVRADAIDVAERDESGRLFLRLHGLAQRVGVSRLYAARFKAM
ncbi:DNA-binding response regulator [Tepidimonas fonticaldi]|uniref:DNA-binding response regulator n=1 Tax=Tepidimonas fonticaldi TaxID=1101373 RepID=A0A1A6DST5_9BURK|nr:LytTR family DNA-binding domain-containing protein [Tepidimonas fonticaldi]OBS29865.1 DNA-binding response regulator [Tepidimonas fonticaldi]